MRRWATSLLGALVAAPAAFGADSVDHEITLTLDPITFAVWAPFLEITGEYQASQKIGAAIIGGIGYRDSELVWDAGGQANGYVYGDFNAGILVGAEALVIAPEVADELSTSVGAYAGGKYAFSEGPTGMLQLGASYTMPELDLDAGEVGFLINLGLGWSF